jgi:hypothetical protein
MKLKTLSNISLAFLIFILGCFPEDYEILPTSTESKIHIDENIGIKLESFFVTDEAAMNVKVENPGNYIIKIHHITGRVVSKELVELKKGDNALKLYTGALPKEPYTIAFYNKRGHKLGETIINLY